MVFFASIRSNIRASDCVETRVGTLVQAMILIMPI